jgi:hypothetical protein
VSPLCPIVREGLADYLGERLPAPQRRILREHLAVCGECGELAAAQDASLVFARPTPPEDVSAEETASILASVRTGVAHIEAERRIRSSRPGRHRMGRVAAAAAVVLLALTIPAGSRRDSRVASAPAPPPVPTNTADAPSGTGLSAAALPQESAAPADGATVYELNPGAGREEPRVVWIVDRGLDI